MCWMGETSDNQEWIEMRLSRMLADCREIFHLTKSPDKYGSMINDIIFKKFNDK